jgi:DNA polymerase I-like protein with 3'-5' exonuclease and polymerase domains
MAKSHLDKKFKPRQLGLFKPELSWTRPKSLPDWRNYPALAWDFETRDSGLNTGRGPGWAFADGGYTVGVAVCNGDEALYIPYRHPDGENNFGFDAVQRWLLAHITTPKIINIFQNATYDLGWLYREFGRPSEPIIVNDTMVMAAMVNENRHSYSLEALCQIYRIPGKDDGELNDFAHALGYHPKKDLWQLPATAVGKYAAQDAFSTFQLWKILLKTIEQEDLREAVKLEHDLIDVFVRMRVNGIRINVEKAEQTSALFKEKLAQELVHIERLLSHRVTMTDLLSSQRLAIFFDGLGLNYPRTKQGAPSFESKWLETLDHPFPQAVAHARKYESVSSKFLDTYILSSTVNGRMHPEVHQLRDGQGGTRSYRISYSNPPLQQMPARDEDIAVQVRGCFEPEEGAEWGSFDYSQQEPRFTVHYAAELQAKGWEKAVKYYQETPDADYHQMVSDMASIPRSRAKIINLSLAYGMQITSLCARLGLSRSDGEELLVRYHEEVPFIKDMGRIISQKASHSGFIRLIDGARCRFDMWEDRDAWGSIPYPLETAKKSYARIKRSGLHKAMNRLIQGSAARQTKKAMLSCANAGYLPIIQMHDELGHNIYNRGKDEKIVREIMCDTIKLRVPMKVDAAFGKNWGEAT